MRKRTVGVLLFVCCLYTGVQCMESFSEGWQVCRGMKLLDFITTRLSLLGQDIDDSRAYIPVDKTSYNALRLCAGDISLPVDQRNCSAKEMYSWVYYRLNTLLEKFESRVCYSPAQHKHLIKPRLLQVWQEAEKKHGKKNVQP